MTRHPFAAQLDLVEPARRVGFVSKVSPSHIEATGPLATIGDICEINCRRARERGPAESALAEVAAVDETHIVLIPFDPATSIFPDAMVVARPSKSLASVGDAFAGRAIDALGEPIDGGPPILAEAAAPVEGRVMAPMERIEPNSVLETGIRTLDGLLTIGRGQRIGVFSASGVGKTTLIRQLATQVACDHCVLCLVGERGREVEGIWRALSAGASRTRYACVAATSDQSAVLRARAVRQALCLAEHWRARGEHVLFVVDSVTRFAMALREIGLAAGAPPTLRAYTPNVFAALPRIVERCGAAKSGGSITAIMTVLSETDDNDDPIAEVMKSLLDGHIVLSRTLAEQGRFPAIDVLRSVSRQCEQLMTGPHAAAARQVISLLATYQDARVMIESGIYKPGSNPRIDEAVRERDGILKFLLQGADERTPFAATVHMLQSAIARSKAYA